MGKVLSSDEHKEKERHELRKHLGPVKVYKQSRLAYWFYYLITFGFLFLAFFVEWNRVFRIGCFILFFLFLLYFEIHIIKNHLLIDDKKVEIRIGFFHITTKSVPLQMITDMRIKQNFLQGLLHFGTLEINTGGGEHYELSMEKLRNPLKVKEAIEERLHKLHLYYSTTRKI